MLPENFLATLATWPGVANEPRAVRVQIGRRVYEGARYVHRTLAPEGSRAHREGRLESHEDAYYLLGGLPASYGRAYYRLEGDERDWYVAGYYPPSNQTPEDAATFAEFHPFGAHFSLHPWNPAHGRIDSYEPTTKARMPIRELVT